MPWGGFLLILAGLAVAVFTIRMMVRPNGAARESCVWPGFLAVGLLGLGVATVLGLYTW